MGRKKVPHHQKKVQTSVSLKQSTVETIDSWTHRRSAWIEHAIEMKIKEETAMDNLTLQQILEMALHPFHKIDMSFEERAVIERIYHRLCTD